MAENIENFRYGSIQVDIGIRRLLEEHYGFSHEHAEGIAAAIHMRKNNFEHLATKEDLKDLRNEVQSEIKGLRAEVQSEIKGLRAEVQSEIKDVRSEITILRQDVKIWLLTMTIFLVSAPHAPAILTALAKVLGK